MYSNIPSILLVLDIDHTLADPSQRYKRLPNIVSFFRSCGQDKPMTDIINAVSPLFDHKEIDIIFVTARPNDKIVVSETKQWLDKVLPTRPVFFRPSFSLDRAHTYKYKTVEAYRKPHHQQVIIIDNEPSICRHFEKKGHSAIQIHPSMFSKNVEQIQKIATDIFEKRFCLGENCLVGPPSML